MYVSWVSFLVYRACRRYYIGDRRRSQKRTGVKSQDRVSLRDVQVSSGPKDVVEKRMTNRTDFMRKVMGNRRQGQTVKLSPKRPRGSSLTGGKGTHYWYETVSRRCRRNLVIMHTVWNSGISRRPYGHNNIVTWGRRTSLTLIVHRKCLTKERRSVVQVTKYTQ